MIRFTDDREPSDRRVDWLTTLTLELDFYTVDWLNNEPSNFHVWLMANQSNDSSSRSNSITNTNTNTNSNSNSNSQTVKYIQ